MAPDQLVQILRSLSCLYYLPPAPWLDQVASDLASRWTSTSAKELGMTAFLFGNLNHQPSTDFLKDYTAAFTAKLPTCDAADLTHVLWAAAKGDWPVTAQFVGDVATTSQLKVSLPVSCMVSGYCNRENFQLTSIHIFHSNFLKPTMSAADRVTNVPSHQLPARCIAGHYTRASPAVLHPGLAAQTGPPALRA